MCDYFFKEGDAPVIKGTVKVGDKCRVAPVKQGEAAGKYCYGHAMSLGLVPQSVKDDAARKRRETNLSMTTEDRKRRRNNRSFDNENKEAKRKGDKTEYKPDESSMVDTEILEYLGVNQDYDATKDYCVQRELNEHPETDDYAKKICLARWMETKSDHRNPDNIEKLAEILEVSTFTLNNWRHSRFVTELLADDIRHRATKMEQFIVYHLGVAVKKGDLKAIELYQKYYAAKPIEKEKTTAPKLSKDLLEEAEKHYEELKKGTVLDKSIREQGLVLKDSLTNAIISRKKEELTN